MISLRRLNLREEAMKKILITGGGGFIGTHLAERFAGKYELCLFDNFRRNSLEHAPHLLSTAGVEMRRGDILDPESIKEALQGVDCVLHLAAIAGVSSYYNEPLKTLETNILGTINVLKSMQSAGNIESLVYFSTSEVYGGEAAFVREDKPFNFGPVMDKRWTYATSKVAGENFCLRYGEAAGFRTVVVRPFNIYGPRQTGEGAISNFCTAALKSEPLVVYGSGTAVRSWCYVSDMVDAVDKILHTPSVHGPFNIGNPRETQTTVGLARMVASLVPGSPVEYKEIDRMEIGVRIPDISKATEQLGFSPKVDLLTGLSHTLDWYRTLEQRQ